MARKARVFGVLSDGAMAAYLWFSTPVRGEDDETYMCASLQSTMDGSM